MKRSNRILSVAACFFSFVGSVAIAADGADKLTSLLPQGANAIVAADVGFLRESPQAGRMRWVARSNSGTASMLPSIAGVKQVCLGAHLDVDSLRPDWELALLEVGALPPLDQMAQAIGGYADTIGGAKAAWSPGGACYLGLDAQTLVSAQPGNRQLIARWIEYVRTPAANRSSPYLRTAAAMVTNQTPIVLAVDLRDAFAFPAVLKWLRVSSDDAVAKTMTDPIPAAKVLAAIRGVTIVVNLSDATTAVATIDFGADASPLAQLAQPLFLQVLSDHGLAIPDITRWTFAAAGPRVTAQGPLSDQGLRQLLSVLQAPSPMTATAAAGGAGQATPAAAREGPSGSPSMAAASGRYFDEVGKILDGVQPGASLGDQAGWLWRGAKRIDQLSAVDVDPDMLKWGASVSANLRDASAILDAGQQRVTAGAQSAQAPVGSYTNGWDDTGAAQRDAQYRADVENYRRQNRAASTQIRAQVTQQANKPLQAALDSRGQIRATMVGRYGAAFK